MTDDFYHDVFISIKEWDSRKNQISAGIHHFMDQNKEKICKSFSHICEDTEFFILLIKDIFIYLKNNTELFNYLSITQIKEIPPIIYRIAKDTFSIQRFVDNENEFLRKIKNLYGFIYLATNKASYNKKVYIGQTIRTIEVEWGEIFSHGITLRKKREEYPSLKKQARYILNAIAKYPDNVWDLKLIDIAFSKSELDNKERCYIIEIYDSMNPEKGYNLTTGGRTGGRLSPATKKKVSESVTDVWKSPGYTERLSKSQLKSWENEERQKKASEAQLKSWESEERREKTSEDMKKRWKNEEMRKKMEAGLTKSAKKIWQNPTEAMLKSLKNMHQNTRKDIVNLKEFLIDIKNTKNQREFWQGDLFKVYGIKSHMTLNSRIKEILGGFGVNNHGEAHRFFYDRSIDEVMKYLDNPKGYNIFRDPFTKQFFIDVKNSKKGADLHKKYRVWHKQGLITKIKRIVGKFGINNYTSLKMFLQEKGINQSLKYFENIEKN